MRLSYYFRLLWTRDDQGRRDTLFPILGDGIIEPTLHGPSRRRRATTSALIYNSQRQRTSSLPSTREQPRTLIEHGSDGNGLQSLLAELPGGCPGYE